MPKPLERPILFSGEMVRAILEGRKTQTRRVIKPQPGELASYAAPAVELGDHASDWAFSKGAPPAQGSWGFELIRCPYGQPGDRLWVRETWAYGCAEDEADKIAVFRADVDVKQHDVRFIARLESLRETYKYNRWRPSIHMPRWASRLTLEITKIRAERIQQISEEDAIAEGSRIPVIELPKSCQKAAWTERQQFSRLWDSINGKRGFGWEANPWVWVIEFRRERGTDASS